MPEVAFSVQSLQATEGLSNTIIQIKRSQNTAAPTTLANGELAYAFSSDKLFIGQTDSATDSVSVEYIGGKLLVDKVANLESILLGGGGELTLGALSIDSLTFPNDTVGTNNSVMFVKENGVVDFVKGTSGQIMQVAANGTPTFDELNGGTFA